MTRIYGIVVVALAAITLLLGASAARGMNEISIVVPDQPVRGALFGASVAGFENTLAIGAPLDAPAGIVEGAVHTFVREEGHWKSRTVLSPTAGAHFDLFGRSVVVEDGILLIGAPGDDSMEADCGAVYVFEYIDGGWTLKQKLHASDASPGAFFGYSIAVSGEHVVIGAPYDQQRGAVYCFVADQSGLRQVAKLADAEADDTAFGFSVACSESLLAVAAPAMPTMGSNSGALYVYRTTTGPPTLEQVLVDDSSLAGANDFFGYDVAVSDKDVVVGIYRDANDAGAVRVFSFDGSGWILAQSIESPAVGRDLFGSSLDIDGNSLLVGASHPIESDDDGRAYLFVRYGGQWVRAADFAPSSSPSGTFLGSSVAVFNETIVAGAPGYDVIGDDSGGVLVFGRAECAAGKVGALKGQFENVLLVNGSAGDSERRVLATQPAEVRVTVDAPTGGPSPAAFVLYAWNEDISDSVVTLHPRDLGAMCFPTFVTVGTPKPVVVWNNLGYEHLLGPPDFPSLPAPSVVFERVVGQSLTFTLQGLIEDLTGGSSTRLSITNAVGVTILD